MAEVKDISKNSTASTGAGSGESAPSQQQPTKAQLFHAWRLSFADVGGDQAAMTDLCDYLIEGRSLLSWTRTNGYSYNTVLGWIEADPARAAQYARAREERSDAMADEVLEVSRRDCSAPVTDKEGNFLGTVVDKGKVAQARLEADSLKWMASKMKPKTYGDKLDVTATVDARSASTDALAKELGVLGLAAVGEALKRKADGNQGEDGRAA